MELIDGYAVRGTDVTAEELAAALRPIKAFRNRYQAEIVLPGESGAGR